ncbi:MAG: hypothetical protein DWB56_00630 [Candidatus Jettenia sp.]|uniref:Uncharacterized protein n=1 Tax=Candidatus Jettenia caeni TaxID=247490 RepID=I3IJ29_9BACT|nr:hypothetical protein [Candidatus Jettenia sp. AMX1]MBC6927457.1 hypothetical protein [Candidatus Jettenia sp.]NUN21986.1 hypothetical protein [Candidatus Jettenia caeni]KAA0249744.1 MAG: hypothetical protein EDM77_07495 [Candidatus Jettenia sp. AMX1]MCE7879140.1 hypothetical protein [Candidatus Jettenia sp. AMX1]MCQ3925741.1 hypothetical protein [Candidatus Jettenia sp.]
MLKITDIEKDSQKKLRKELLKRGVDPDAIKDLPVGVKESNQFIFRYGNTTVSIPAPSQDVMNSLFKKYSGVFVGASIVLLTMAVVNLTSRPSGED